MFCVKQYPQTISNSFPTHLSPPVWLVLPHYFSLRFPLCPVLNRWLQPATPHHHGSPRSPDTYVQAARQKPLGQWRATGPSGAFAIPRSPTASANAISPPAEGQRQWPWERLAWHVRGALSCLFHLLHLVSYEILALNRYYISNENEI